MYINRYPYTYSHVCISSKLQSYLKLSFYESNIEHNIVNYICQNQ